jgi:hypothetical protein
MTRTRRRGQAGLTVVAVLVYFAIASVLYFAFLYAPMGWRYYQIREAVGHAANVGFSIPDLKYMEFKCAEFIKKQTDLTIRPGDCQLKILGPGAIRGSYSYSETIHFFPTDKKEIYKFDVVVESINK